MTRRCGSRPQHLGITDLFANAGSAPEAHRCAPDARRRGDELICLFGGIAVDEMVVGDAYVHRVQRERSRPRIELRITDALLLEPPDPPLDPLDAHEQRLAPRAPDAGLAP